MGKLLDELGGEPPKAAAPKTPKPYGGILKKPIILDPDCNLPGIETLGPKMDALFDHFGVERSDYTSLCWALAFEHVPGFSFRRPAGAPEVWQPVKLALLVWAVRRFQAGKQGAAATVQAACQHIAASYGLRGNPSAGTISRRYYAALKDENVVELADNLIRADIRAENSRVEAGSSFRTLLMGLLRE